MRVYICMYMCIYMCIYACVRMRGICSSYFWFVRSLKLNVATDARSVWVKV